MASKVEYQRADRRMEVTRLRPSTRDEDLANRADYFISTGGQRQIDRSPSDQRTKK